MTRESSVEDYLTAQVEKAGGEVRKVKWIGRHSAPDRLVLLKGKHPLVELKATGKKPNDAQFREHERLVKAGFVVWVIDSKAGVDRLVKWACE